MKLRRDTDSQDLHDEVKKYFTLENFGVAKFRNTKSQTVWRYFKFLLKKNRSV